MPDKIAKQIVEDLVTDLCGRQGFDYMWEDCAKDIKREIKRTWIALVQKRLREK